MQYRVKGWYDGGTLCSTGLRVSMMVEHCAVQG